MINLPWWSTIPKERLREIQEQKIFKLNQIIAGVDASTQETLSDLTFR